MFVFDGLLRVYQNIPSIIYYFLRRFLQSMRLRNVKVPGKIPMKSILSQMLAPSSR